MKKYFCILMVLLAFAFSANAQTTTGRLTGTISSPDGVLPNATIVARDNVTGKELTATSSEDGTFLFPQLEFGTYTVTVSVAGFKTFIANEVKIDVGREYNLTPTLEVGNIQESVTVTAGADVVTSTTAQVTNTVSPQQILSLPLVTRNPLNLVQLQAGVVSADNTFQQSTINGMRTTFTNITRDGINIQDNFIRANATDFAPGRPSVDDTGEFTITTSNQESDQGYGGAQVRLVTPRGTKDFHGALFAYNRNSEFAANDFFNNRSGIVRPFRNRNQFGGKIGGPLVTPNFGEGGPSFDTDKGFFFFAYEGIRDPLTNRATRTILTPAARTGSFSFLRATAGDPTTICPSGAANSVCTIPNLLTFARAQGLAVPATIDPVIQSQIIDRLPTTSNDVGGDGLNTAGFTLNRAANQTQNTYTTRIDYDASERDSFNTVFSYNKLTVLRPDADANGFSVIPGVTQSSTNKTFVMAYRRVLSSNFVNEVRGGVFTSEVPFTRTDPLPSFFFGSANNLLANLFQSGAFSGGSVSNPNNNFLNQGRNTKTFNFQDNADLVIGDHSLRFGGQYQLFKINSYGAVGLPSIVLAAGNGTPALATSNFAAAGGISTAQLTAANNFLALYGGLYNTAVQTFQVESQTSGFQPVANFQPFRYSNLSFYVADRWSVARGLTISAGVRYEIYPALKLNNGLALEPVIPDVNNPLPTLLSRTGTSNFIGGNSGEENTYYKTDYNNFAPSIGIAYTPRFESGIGKFIFGSEGRTVFRGGYSEAFGNDSVVTSINNAASGNPGLAATQNILVNLNNTVTGGAPSVPAPAFIAPPRTYLQNNEQNNNFGTVFLIDPNIKTPKVRQYSFGIQREFLKNFALEIRYVGSSSNNLVRGVDINQLDIFNNGFLADFERARANNLLTGNPFCTSAGCQPLQIFQEAAGTTGRLGVSATNTSVTGRIARNTFINNLTNGTPADLAQAYINSALNLNNHPTTANPNATPFLNLLPNPAAGAIDFVINDATYNYNSLQVELRRRFAQGLYLQANYTFSKNLTNAVGTGQTLFEPYLDNNNKGLDKARADFDLTHVFNFNGIYQLPFGKGKMFLDQGGLIDKIFGGWEVSALGSWTSGPPITFVDNRGTLNRTGRSARQTPFTNLTNDQIRELGGVYEANGKIYFINPSVINPATGRASEGFNTTPFAGQVFFNVNPGQTGNMSRFVINGPKYFNVNAALLKNIRFSESMRLQIRAEAFNLFNNVNFGFVTAAAGTGTNAEQRQSITSTTFGQVTALAGAGARQIQFAARFEF